MPSHNIDLGNGNNTISPTPTDDNYVIIGADGNNTVTLGAGNDQFTLGNGANTLTVGDGTDFFLLGGGNNTVTTGNGNSSITVGNGNDTVTVGTGSNAIALGTGLDTVQTGAGNNVVSVSAAAFSGDTIQGALTSGDGSTNRLLLTTAGTMSPVNVSGFQSYQLASGGANDLTLVEANFARLPAGSITVLGGNSGNTVNASALSAAHSVVIHGGAGIDMFTGGAGDDRFIFAASDLSGDTVAGGAGNNTLELASGNGVGTVNGLGGANFSGLAVVDVDAGAKWEFTSNQAVTDTINLAVGAIAEFGGAVGSGHTINFTGSSESSKSIWSPNSPDLSMGSTTATQSI